MIAALISEFGPYIAAAGAFLATMIGVYFKGRKDKHNEVQAKTAETVIKTVKKGKAIEKANRDSGAKSRRDRLRRDASDSK